MHRYVWVATLCQGKVVLDIACGEGYSSALPTNAAESIVGIDISQRAVAHAQEQYIRINLRYMRGSATDTLLPILNGSLFLQTDIDLYADAQKSLRWTASLDQELTERTDWAIQLQHENTEFPEAIRSNTEVIRLQTELQALNDAQTELENTKSFNTAI